MDDEIKERMANSHPIFASVFRAGAQIEELRESVRFMAVPENVRQILDDHSAYAHSLPDDLYEVRDAILTDVRHALGAIDAEDDAWLMTRLEKIKRVRADADPAKEAIEKHAAAQEAGSKGGKTPKRKAWADQYAKSLSDQYRGSTKEQIWGQIPDASIPGFAGDKVETNDADFEVYRDGETLIAKDENTIKESKVTQRTFMRHYLKTR